MVFQDYEYLTNQVLQGLFPFQVHGLPPLPGIEHRNLVFIPTLRGYAATFASNAAYSDPCTCRHSHSKKPMPDPLLLPSIALPQPPPLYLPAPKFQIGDWVFWKAVKNPDFGHITGVCWATESSAKAIGFHYTVLLDQGSPSKRLGIDLDFAFQDDLELMPPSHTSV